MKVYLSPSTQDWNGYAGGSNEEVQMRRVVFPAADLLRAAGHTVRVGGTVSAKANALDANAWGPDLYVAVHSNAGGGHGTEAWYYPGSSRGKALAQAVYDKVAAASTAPDRGLKSSSGYVELNTPKAPATIIELAFHDCAEEAAEIRDHGAKFARAIAEGVLKVAGGSIASPKPALSGECRLFVVHTRVEYLNDYRAVAKRRGSVWNDDHKVPVLAPAVIGQRLPDAAKMAAQKVTAG